MGTMAKKVNQLLIEVGIEKKELAKILNTTQSNISGKLRRDNFSEKELQEIAEACGATFEGKFIVKETRKEI
jgi:transcriptional regulator with XRE-family HTH domain